MNCSQATGSVRDRSSAQDLAARTISGTHPQFPPGSIVISCDTAERSFIVLI